MIKGYNAWFKEVADDDNSWVQVNTELLTAPTWPFTGLDSETDYSARIAFSAVDMAGNEGPRNDPLPPGTLQTPARPVGDVPLSDEDKAAIDAIVAASMVESGQPGVLVSITGPRGSYAKAYGNTKTSGGRPLTLDDHVRIGSATKAFTAMAVLKAIDDELISFDDTLASFAHPTIDLTKIPNAEKISIRHLLSMRAGVYDYQADLWTQLVFLMNPTASFSAASAVRVIVNHNAPVFEPGTSYAYSNSNYVLLGLILEVVRGKSIKQVLAEDIIAPLGMTETQWPSGSSVPEPAAAQTAANPELFGAAGALTSTIGDLTKWTQALRDHDLISAELYDIWTSWFWDYDTGWANLRYQSEYIPLRYGYGLGAESIGSWQGHPGGFLVGSSGWGILPFFEKTTGATIAIAENKATSSPVLAAQTRIFTRIANYLYPETMFDAVHPLPPRPAIDLGFDAVSAPFSGYQKTSGAFTASDGADVFAVVTWDRPSAPSTVTYGGVAMTQLGSAFHNNSSAYGGVAMYRLPAAGTGAAKTLVVDGAGAWVSAYAVSYTDVTGVGTPTFATGSGTALAQSITNTSGVTLQAFSAGAAGGPTFTLSGIIGALVRAFQLGTNPLLWLNTAIKSGVIAATAAGNNFWAAIAVHIAVKEQQTVKPSGASITTTKHTPTVRIEEANKVLTPAPASIHTEGGRPGSSAFVPSGAVITATGGTPVVSVTSPPAVTFLSVGAGNRSTGSGNSLSTSWSHEVTQSDTHTVLIAAVGASYDNSVSDTLNPVVSYAGTPMTLIPGAYAGSSGENTRSGILWLYYLVNPPVGAGTVTASYSRVAGSPVVYSLQGNSMVYTNWSSFGTPAVASEITTANPSVTITSDTRHMALAACLASTNITAVNKTQRYRGGGSVLGPGDYFAAQDAAGAASVPFVFTAASGGSITHAYVAVDLIP